MSFDDLLALLLFVGFIVLPALSRLGRSRRGGPPAGGPQPGGPQAGGPQAGRSPEAGGRPPGTTDARSTPTETKRPGSLSDLGDELERRLAEARARVQQASQTTAAPRSSPPVAGRSRPRTIGGPTRPPSVAGRTPRPGTLMTSRDRDDGLLGTPLEATAAATLGRERREASRKRLEEAPALEVDRGVTAKAARPGAGWLALDPHSITQGIAWHQILGEPRARMPLGGSSSTRRSR